MTFVVPAVPWYALQVRPRFERIASKHLRAKGYEEYLPVSKLSHRWSDRTKTIEIPLFPGYMFCRLDLRYRLPVLIAPGVLSIVGVAGIPVVVTDAEIRSIQQAVASGLRCEGLSSIPLGAPVSITHGPLAGLAGTLVGFKSNLRLIISLPLLQRSLSVEIDSDCVEKIRRTAPLLPAEDFQSYGERHHAPDSKNGKLGGL